MMVDDEKIPGIAPSIVAHYFWALYDLGYDAVELVAPIFAVGLDLLRRSRLDIFGIADWWDAPPL